MSIPNPPPPFFVNIPPQVRRWTEEERKIELKRRILERVFEKGDISVNNSESIDICRELVIEGVLREPMLHYFDINA